MGWDLPCYAGGLYVRGNVGYGMIYSSIDCSCSRSGTVDKILRRTNGRTS